MKICKKEDEVKPIAGHLYKSKVANTELGSNICIYTKTGKMVRLIDGSDTIVFSSINNWEDVTDKYCFTEI